MSETALVSRILGALEKLGVLAWRMNSGVAKRRGYRIRLAPAGTPDIIGALPGTGVMFGIETKDVGARETGKVKLATKAAQAKWRRIAEGTGVRVARVRTMEEFWAVWRGWTIGKKSHVDGMAQSEISRQDEKR